jgi:hypothetical protein
VLGAALLIYLPLPASAAPAAQQVAKLTIGAEGAFSDQFGESAAMSADGGTAVLGAPFAPGAWVYTRTGSTWTKGPKLTQGTEAQGTCEFGKTVAISGDGNTILIGGPADNSEVGAVWVFTRSGSTWVQQGPKLTVGEALGEFGKSVALSNDGNTALINGSNPLEPGAAWVFTRSGSTWTEQAKLTAAGRIEGQDFAPEGVALSADGNTALIGAPIEDASWVFTRSGSTWTQQATLAGPALNGFDTEGFGFSVALSAEGNMALIGDPGASARAGEAAVFARSGSTWSQQAKLVGGGESGAGKFGSSVGLSREGALALIGGPVDNEHTGAAWLFSRSGSTWTQDGGKLIGGEAVGKPGLGSSVALSSQGADALIGGPLDNEHTGAAWAFSLPPVPAWYKNERIIGSSHASIFGYGELTLAATNQELAAECVSLIFGSISDESREGGALRGYGQILGWWGGGHAPTAEHPELGSRCRLLAAGGASPGEAWITPEGPLHTVVEQAETCINKQETRLSECPTKASEPGAERVLTPVVTEVSREAPSLPWNAELLSAEGPRHLRVGAPSEAGRSCSEAPAPAGCVRMTLVSPTLGWQLPVEGTLEPAVVNGIHNALTPSALEFESEKSGTLSSPAIASGGATLSGYIKIVGLSGQELITAR